MTMTLTDEQDAVLSAINDKWGVASWHVDVDGVAHIELDDGDEGTLDPDGSNTWGVTAYGP
jgi:hypothetical protein